MSALTSLRRAVNLYKADKELHIADIAVLKADAFGTRGNATCERRLAGLDRLDGADHDLDALAALPQHTFGYAYARFMLDNGLSPFVLTDEVAPEVRRRNAFAIRYATTHDMFHVLLGFDTSWPGELGVLGFAVGQGYTGWQVFAAVLAFVLYPFLCGFRVRALIRAWRRGLRLGRRASYLLALPLEQRFEEDLGDLRAELGLLPEPSDHSLAA